LQISKGIFMKSIAWTKYGPPEVLKLKEIEKPIPKDDEGLIKVIATTVTAGDCEMRRLDFPLYLSFPMRIYIGFFKPKRIRVIGQELAGEIVEVGKDVKSLKVGDQVFGTTGFKFGAYAEYICLPEKSKDMSGPLTHKPTNMSFEEAAAVPTGGLEVLHFLRKGNIKRGEKILINGAGGSIGSFGVQLAKYFGAEVTAVDSAEKLEMLGSIGADHVIDYAQEDFTEKENTYDVIFDVIGKSSFSGSLRSLGENGRYLIANPNLIKIIRALLNGGKGNKKIVTETTIQKTEDLQFLKELIEVGKLKTIIDRKYPMEEIVEAHRYVETGEKIGNVIITP